MKKRLAADTGVPEICFDNIHHDDMGPILESIIYMIGEKNEKAIQATRAFIRDLDQARPYVAGPEHDSADYEVYINPGTICKTEDFQSFLNGQ
jgi:hypothetical protein